MSYHTYVTLKGDKPKAVKNLGWLLRNWQEVDHFVVTDEHPLCRKQTKKDATRLHCDWDCHLTAVLREDNGRRGGKFVTPFASREVLSDWLRRPVFIGVKVEWFGETLTIEKKTPLTGANI